MRRLLLAALLASAAVLPARAQIVGFGPGTAATIITACGASTTQILYNNAGSCAGSAGYTLTKEAGGVGPTITALNVANTRSLVVGLSDGFNGTINAVGGGSVYLQTAGVTALIVDGISHVRSSSATAPALTSCGTGTPAITGTDAAGIVTMGTGAPTGCVITFNQAYIAAPYCVVTWIATPLASQSYVTSNTAITLTQTGTSSNKVQYICLGQSGG